MFGDRLLECDIGLRVKHESKITPALNIAMLECKSGTGMLAVPAGMVVGHLNIV